MPAAAEGASRGYGTRSITTPKFGIFTKTKRKVRRLTESVVFVPKRGRYSLATIWVFTTPLARWWSHERTHDSAIERAASSRTQASERRPAWKAGLLVAARE